MRPATNAVPKALLTVVDRPSIQWVVEEAARAGVREAVAVVDPEARALVERHFRMLGDRPQLAGVQVRTVVQSEAKGLGHAVACGREAVAGRPFFVMTADDLLPPGRDVLPRLAAAAAPGGSVLCLRRLPEEALSAKGVVAPASPPKDGVLRVAGAVEKPPPGAAPSPFAIQGRYLFAPEAFDILAEAEPGHGGEIQLTDAIDVLGRRGRCRGYVTEAAFLDTGHARGFVEANLALAAASPDFGEDMKSLMKQMLGEGG